MTRQKSFKRIVRARMDKTGESYTAARSALLAAEEPTATQGPAPAMSDEAIRRRTGRGWEHWLKLLDAWGATERPHKEVVAWLVEEHGIDGWGAQAVTVTYERARGLRAVGEGPNGFTVTASKTVAVPVDRLYEAFMDRSLRERWLPEAELRERTATKPRSARFDWGDGTHQAGGRLRVEGRGEERRGARARAARRRRGSGAHEGVLARAGRDAEGDAGGVSEFERQVENLIAKGYPEAAGLEPAAFRRRVEPLREAAAVLPEADARPGVGERPVRDRRRP